MVPPISDLVVDSKLETHFHQNGTIHTYLDVTRGRQRVSRQEHWRWKRDLGQGGYGRVWLETCTEGKTRGSSRAVKMVRKQLGSSCAIDYNRELEAIAKFSHHKYEACFIKSFGWYEDASAIYIAMEYFPYGDLSKYLSYSKSRLPVEEARELTRQILEALFDMHRNGFAHRDLKPSNILIKSQPPDCWWIKLSDFGISKRAEDGQRPSTIKGTPDFMAPELQGFKDTSQGDTPIDFQAADMWALGEIAFRMLTGECTFSNPRALWLYCDGQDKYPSVKLVSFAGGSVAQFVSSLMVVQPKLRMKAFNALKHPWIIHPGKEAERDSANGSVSDVSLIPFDQVDYPAVPSSEPTQEASARWSTISNIAYVQPAIPSILDPSQPTPMSYQELISQPMMAAYGPSSRKFPRRQILLENHNGRDMKVTFAVFSPNGKGLATTSGGNVWLWDLRSGAIFRKLIDLNRAVVHVAFSPDSRMVAAVSHGGPVIIWASHSGAVLYKFGGHSELYNRRILAFSPDGKILAVSKPHTIEFWDSRPGRLLQRIESAGYYICAMAFSPDGKTLVFASNDHTVKLWDTQSRTILRELGDWGGEAENVAFSPAGKVLALVLYDRCAVYENSLWIYDSPSEGVFERRMITMTKGPPYHGAIAFSPDGKTLASQSDVDSITLWDSQSGEELQKLHGCGYVKAMTFSLDGRTLTSVSEDGKVIDWV